jgi:acetoacetyl-CoA reductase/3-oxoacyl-[acyl-carrier protein] reductase
MILITGASRGIGNFLFNKFLESGDEVHGTYYLTEPNIKLKQNFSKVNIADIDDVRQNLGNVIQNFSKIVLINCAGTNYNALAHKADSLRWANVINSNLIGTFNVIQTVLPLMREQGYGRIINFSSIVAQIGIAGTSAYAASKSGLWGLSKCLAVENAKKGITINTLNLGYFDIGMINEVPENIRAEIKSKIPFGNFGNPEDIFRAVNFLIQDQYITGSSIDINGGLH